MSGLISRIHQGRYDTEKKLLTLRENALNKKRIDVLDAVNQRLKRLHPNVYQRLVGPLHERLRDIKYKCYCNNPTSLYEVYKDIVSDSVHIHALTCAPCWEGDLAITWGYYGWSRKIISIAVWTALCDKRARYLFVE